MDVGQSRRFYRQGYLKIQGLPAEKFSLPEEKCFCVWARRLVSRNAKTRKMDGLVEATRSIFVAGRRGLY